MTRPETSVLSIRLPADAASALQAYAEATGTTVSEAVLHAIYAFLQDQATTTEEARTRMEAETELSAKVAKYAEEIKDAPWNGDVTLEMFEWIETNHLELYERAVGPNREHNYRINPKLAKRFAYAISADYEVDENGNTMKGYLPRNANKLIQSYTKLKKSI